MGVVCIRARGLCQALMYNNVSVLLFLDSYSTNSEMPFARFPDLQKLWESWSLRRPGPDTPTIVNYRPLNYKVLRV